ncbi:MAG TPA: segregation/condensation protein A [Trichocoleus sp.]|jgi:segregation and condensation protein A
MTLSLAQNAIALLIDLAERGEIDPWDVQVIEVIDRFLSKLQPVEVLPSAAESGRAPYEADLSQSGQAFLYASMLLLLKADSLARLEAGAAQAADEAEFLEEIVPGNSPLPLHLERRIRRRAVAPAASSRRVTLQELIAQLNLMATAMAEQKPRRALARRPRPHSRKQALRTIAQLAHQENLSEVAALLEQFLADHWQDMSSGAEWLDFEQLLGLWCEAQEQSLSSQEPELQTAESHSPAGNRVGVFWALLFLSAQSKVELSQEVFYQDLKVRSLTEPSRSPESEVPVFVLPD